MDVLLQTLVTVDTKNLVQILRDILDKLGKQGAALEGYDRVISSALSEVKAVASAGESSRAQHILVREAVNALEKKVEKLNNNEQMEQLRGALARQSARADELAAELERQRQASNDMQRRFEDAILNLRQQLPINQAAGPLPAVSTTTTPSNAASATTTNNTGSGGSSSSGRGSGGGSGMVSLSATPASSSITSTPISPATSADVSSMAARLATAEGSLANVQARLQLLENALLDEESSPAIGSRGIGDSSHSRRASSTSRVPSAGASGNNNTGSSSSNSGRSNDPNACQVCNDGKVATLFCKECSKRLCAECDRKTHEPPSMRLHSRTGLSTAVPTPSSGVVTSVAPTTSTGTSSLNEALGHKLAARERAHRDLTDRVDRVNDKSHMALEKIATMEARINELARQVKDGDQNVIDLRGHYNRDVAQLKRVDQNLTEELNSLREALPGMRVGADGTPSEGGLRAYVDMKLKDFATKLQRLEFQDVADNADRTRALGERVTKIERDMVDQKSLDAKLQAIIDQLKNLKEDFIRQLQDQGTECQNCNEGRDAAFQCRECNKRFCRECDRSVHEPPAMRTHTRTAFIANKNGGNSGVRVGEHDWARLRNNVLQLDLRVDNIAETLAQHTKNNHAQLFEDLRKAVDELRKRGDFHMEAMNRDIDLKRITPTPSSTNTSGGNAAATSPLPGASGSGGITAIEYAMGKLHTFQQMLDELKGQVANLQQNPGGDDVARRSEIMSIIDDMQAKLSKLDKGTNRAIRTELKKFERDVLILLENHEEKLNESSVARVHFKCIACDSTAAHMPGPISQAVAAERRSVAPGELPNVTGFQAPPDRPYMHVERGEPLTLYGRDGQVYKGRGDTHVVFSPTANHLDTHFTTYRTDKQQSATARAASPTRRAGSRLGKSGYPARPATSAGIGAPASQTPPRSATPPGVNPNAVPSLPRTPRAVPPSQGSARGRRRGDEEKTPLAATVPAGVQLPKLVDTPLQSSATAPLSPSPTGTSTATSLPAAT